MSARLQAVEGILGSLRQHLGELAGQLSAFSALLKLEYQVIGEHNIQKLEKVCHDKAVVADKIDHLYVLLKAKVDSLGEIMQKPRASSSQDPSCLSSLQQLLQAYHKELKSDFPENSPALYPLKRQIAQLEVVIGQCQRDFEQLKPEVEKNRFILARLLHNHQESYKFWQTTVTEASSSYDKTGLRRGPEAISQFHTKA